MDVFQIGFGILLFFLCGYIFIEVHYFLRSGLSMIMSNICKKKVFILETTSVKGFCLTTDIDSLMTHMNNARFIRELDFAKIDFFQRTGLYNAIKKYGGKLAMNATTIRYRRFIKLFSSYQITTKIIYWDEENIYIEHRFITPPEKFINAIVQCKMRISSCNVDQIINELLSNFQGMENSESQKPEMPLDLQKWIESNEISSALLRSEMVV